MQGDLLVLQPRTAARPSIAEALLALVVVIASALFVVTFRDWYYSFIKIQHRPLLPALHPLLPLGPLAGVLSGAARAKTQRLIGRSVVVGVALGALAVMLVSQRELLAYQCRNGGGRDACCAARLLGATPRDAPMVASCGDLSHSTACVRWRTSQPGLCPAPALTPAPARAIALP